MTLSLSIKLFSVAVNHWFECSAIASRQSRGKQVHLETVNIILLFYFRCSSSQEINSKGSSLLWLCMCYFLWRAIYCHRSRWIHKTTSEKEDVKEAFLTPERLRQILLECNWQNFLSHVQLMPSRMHRLPTTVCPGSNSGAGSGPGTAVAVTAVLPQITLPAFPNTHCTLYIHSACGKQTQPSKGTEFMAYAKSGFLPHAIL